MKAIVIKTNMTYEVIDQDWTLEDFQKAVGGNIENIPSPLPYGTSVIGNDEAKFAGESGGALPLNLVATFLCQSSIMDDDVICGDVVVSSFDETGETTSVTDFAIRLTKFITDFIQKQLDEFSKTIQNG